MKLGVENILNTARKSKTYVPMSLKNIKLLHKIDKIVTDNSEYR